MYLYKHTENVWGEEGVIRNESCSPRHRFNPLPYGSRLLGDPTVNIRTPVTIMGSYVLKGFCSSFKRYLTTIFRLKERGGVVKYFSFTENVGDP